MATLQVPVRLNRRYTRVIAVNHLLTPPIKIVTRCVVTVVVIGSIVITTICTPGRLSMVVDASAV
jgi:hypothetical protein